MLEWKSPRRLHSAGISIALPARWHAGDQGVQHGEGNADHQGRKCSLKPQATAKSLGGLDLAGGWGGNSPHTHTRPPPSLCLKVFPVPCPAREA